MTKLKLFNGSFVPGYKIGDVIGIKSKCCGVHHNVYDFCGVNDILFENIRWTRQSRGVIRCGATNIRYSVF